MLPLKDHYGDLEDKEDFIIQKMVGKRGREYYM